MLLVNGVNVDSRGCPDVISLLRCPFFRPTFTRCKSIIYAWFPAESTKITTSSIDLHVSKIQDKSMITKHREVLANEAIT